MFNAVRPSCPTIVFSIEFWPIPLPHLSRQFSTLRLIRLYIVVYCELLYLPQQTFTWYVACCTQLPSGKRYQIIVIVQYKWIYKHQHHNTNEYTKQSHTKSVLPGTSYRPRRQKLIKGVSVRLDLVSVDRNTTSFSSMRLCNCSMFDITSNGIRSATPLSPFGILASRICHHLSSVLL